MNLAEAAELLAKVQAYDRRQVDRVSIAAWHEALADVPLHFASQAVAAHFRVSSDWLMPAHVLRYVRETSARILREAGPPEYPEGWGDLPLAEQQRLERDYRAAYHGVLLAGRTRDEAHAAADARLGIVRPQLTAHPVHALTVGRKP